MKWLISWLLWFVEVVEVVRFVLGLELELAREGSGDVG